MKHTTKILGLFLLVCLVSMMAFILIEITPALMASVGWHDMVRSVGWVG